MPETEGSLFEPFERELTTGELFSQSFKLAREFYRKVLPVFAIFGVVGALLDAGLAAAGPAQSGLSSSLPSGNATQLLAAESSAISQLGAILLEFAVTLFVLYFAAGVGASLINREWRAKRGAGTRTNIWVDYLSLAITTALVLAIVLLGSLLLLFPALIFATMFYLSPAAASLEAKGPRAALGRSRSLVSHRWAKTFALLGGTALIVYIGSAFVATLATIPLSGTAATIVSGAIQAFVAALLFPLVSASMVVLYYSSLAREKPLKPPPSPYDDLKAQPIGPFTTSATAAPVQPAGGARFCPQCGAELAPGGRFCHNCGRPLSST